MKYPEIEQHSPELRRAIISVLPHFYAHDAAERHVLYRDLTPEQDERFDAALCQQLFKTTLQHKDLNNTQTNVFNRHVLPLTGLGKDCFYLNEHFTDDKPMNSFNTLYDYDYDDWCFQEEARVRNFPEYQRETHYFGRMYAVWARCLNEQNGLVYLTISTMASHLADHARNTMDDLIEQCIPHELVEGDNHGETTESGMNWDFRIDAKGLEGQLEWLKKRCWKYLPDRQQLQAKSFAEKAPQVYWMDTSDKDENNADVILTNHHALSAIRLDNFMNDCQKLLANKDSLQLLEEQEALWCKNVVEKEYSHVMKHYDPTIVSFKQKNKIIMSDGALDDLARIFDESESDDE